LKNAPTVGSGISNWLTAMSPQFCGCHRLVGALAAGKIQHGFPCDGLADLGMPVGRRHHIHVDAAGDEDPPQAFSQNVSPQNA
jgi:hypothetical protein